MDDYTRELLVLADSYLSLVRWRHNRDIPDDMKREIDYLIIKIRKVTG